MEQRGGSSSPSISTLTRESHAPVVAVLLASAKLRGYASSRCDEGEENDYSTDVRLDVWERLEPRHGRIAVPNVPGSVGGYHAWG
jgi:hypothetical protein